MPWECSTLVAWIRSLDHSMILVHSWSTLYRVVIWTSGGKITSARTSSGQTSEYAVCWRTTNPSGERQGRMAWTHGKGGQPGQIARADGKGGQLGRTPPPGRPQWLSAKTLEPYNFWFKSPIHASKIILEYARDALQYRLLKKFNNFFFCKIQCYWIDDQWY